MIAWRNKHLNLKKYIFNLQGVPINMRIHWRLLYSLRSTRHFLHERNYCSSPAKTSSIETPGLEFFEMWSTILVYLQNWRDIAKENRIYIRGEFTRKKCKTAILLYCFHTAGVLHIFMLYNLLSPGISFYRKSQINVKRKPLWNRLVS